ncbi:MAG: FeoB-associated Cys-rich membrane protein [Clostridia bacterium]|nr:FeoB-associated Cys-rich membrane protein [Clostridia bacterium]
MNAADIVLTVLIAAALILCIISMIRRHKKGKGCSCGCSCCNADCQYRKKNDKKQ